MRQPEHQHQHCHHIALADDLIGNVNICTACGVVNLHVQHLSLRLEPAAFRALADMLANAHAKLQQLCLAHPGHPAFAVSNAYPDDKARNGSVH